MGFEPMGACWMSSHMAPGVKGVAALEPLGPGEHKARDITPDRVMVGMGRQAARAFPKGACDLTPADRHLRHCSNPLPRCWASRTEP